MFDCLQLTADYCPGELPLINCPPDPTSFCTRASEINWCRIHLAFERPALQNAAQCWLRKQHATTWRPWVYA